MSNDTLPIPREDDGLSDPPRGAYRVLASIPGCPVRCMMDAAFVTPEEATTFANLAATDYDVRDTEVVFDSNAKPDEEF